jgi:hypothetical protein
MKGLTVSVLTTAFALGLGVGVAQAQKWTGSVPLGDVARQLKAERAKSAKKPRVFTNDDLIALRAASDPAPPTMGTSSSSTAKEADPEDKPDQQTSSNQSGKEAAQAIPVEWSKEAAGQEDYIDRMSKVQVVAERQRKDAKNSPSATKPAQHPSPSPEQATVGQIRHSTAPAGEWAKAKFRVALDEVSVAGKTAKHTAPPAGGQGAVSAPYGEWAKAKFRAAGGAASGYGEPGPIAAPSISSQPPPRQDLGYIERADGQVEAIVAEGEHVGLIEETEAFVKSFHIPAPSPAELELALAPPPPANPPETPMAEAGQASDNPPASDLGGPPSAENGVEVAQQRQPQPAPGNTGESQSEASLQSEPLADYAGGQFRPNPPDNLQAPACPVSPAPLSDDSMNRSTVEPLGYVEKAGGEREAIVELRDQVYLVHEGELFAGKYRVLQLTPNSVEIVEELTEASSAAPDRRRNTSPPPDSK